MGFYTGAKHIVNAGGPHAAEVIVYDRTSPLTSCALDASCKVLENPDPTRPRGLCTMPARTGDTRHLHPSVLLCSSLETYSRWNSTSFILWRYQCLCLLTQAGTCGHSCQNQHRVLHVGLDHHAGRQWLRKQGWIRNPCGILLQTSRRGTGQGTSAMMP